MSRLITRTVLGFLCTWAAALSVSAAVYVEDFSADPGSRGWRVFGNSNLFQWNKGGQNLDVTWNSSEPNSFFFMSLGTVLAKSDDFSFTFELKLKDLQFGTSVNRTNTFQVAAGLMNFRSGTNANYYRGAGTSAAYGVRNVAEWDFFPDDGYGATWATTVVSTNSRWLPAHNFPLELTPGALYRITLAYTASNQTLLTSATKNGIPYGLPPDNSLQSLILTAQPDFRLDTFAIMSYSDAVQIGPTNQWGSILAHGVLDNISINVPSPVLGGVSIKKTNAFARIEFPSKTNWQYGLERTTNLLSWVPVTITNGNGTMITLQDSNAPVERAFYRIRTERP